MFRTVPLSIIRSFSLYTQQWYISYRFVDSLRAGSLDALIWEISASSRFYYKNLSRRTVTWMSNLKFHIYYYYYYQHHHHHHQYHQYYYYWEIKWIESTRYQLDHLGFETQWRRGFPHTSIPGVWPTQSPIKWVSAVFPGSKAFRAWRWSPTAI